MRLTRGEGVSGRERGLLVVLIALLGAVLGLLLGGSAGHAVGPVDTRLSIRPALVGDTRIDVAPLGTLRLDTHDGPFQLRVAVTAVRLPAARSLFNDPKQLGGLAARATADVRGALMALALHCLLAAGLGAGLLSLLVFRRWRPAAAAVAVGLGLVAAGSGTAAATWRPGALSEPRYTGLLASAPALVGDAKDIVDRFGVYREQLAKIVTDVSRLYDVTSTLPVLAADRSAIRVLHVSDLHLNPAGFDVIESLVKQFDIDVVLDTGDLTDHGSGAEDLFANRIAALRVPYVFLRGNHDSAATAAAVARQPNAVVLDATARTVGGLRIFGARDPRFTPDKRTEDDSLGDDALRSAGLAARLRLLGSEPPATDIAMTHDPAMAQQFDGAAPLILAGHTHRRDVHELAASLLVVQGSTGGAGLRGLEGDSPTPIECSVLYLDRSTRRLQAYDDIDVGGLGLTSVQITRHVLPVLAARAAVP